MRFLWIIPQLMCVVLAAPTSRDGMCSVQCSAPDDDRAPFRTGKAYTYKYVTTTVMNFPEAKDKLAPVSYEGSFTIRALTPCELSLSLNSGTRSWEKGSSVTQDDKPLRFSYQDGTIKHLCKSGEWEDWKLNTRKALLSHFETSGFLLSGPVDTYVQENDVSGSCLTRYKVKDSWGKRSITKHKDLQQCSHRDGGKTFIQGHQNAPTGDDEKGSVPLLEANQDCTIELTNNEFKSIECSESHAFNPSFSSDESTDKLLSTTINTKFELIDVKDDGDIRKHFPREAAIEEVSIFFTHYSYVTGEKKSEVSNAKRLLEESCSHFESGHIEAIPKIYLELIELLKAATVEDIWDLVKIAASKGACQRQPVNAHILLMNALSTVRTTASITVMENLLTNDGGWSYAALWVNNLAFVPNPKLEMINSVKSRISQDDVEPKQLLSVAGMAFTACMSHPADCRKTKEIQMLNDIIQKHFPGPDQIKDRNTEDKVITAFKAVGNLGFLTDKTVESVKSYVTSDWPSLSVKLAAMDSFRRVPCGTPNVEKFYWDVMANKGKYNPAVQIFAYVSAMRCVSEETVDKVFNILDQDCSNQVGSFVVSHMKNLLGSSPRLGGALRSKIESYLLGNKADDFMNSDFRKFSRNYDLSLRPMKDAGIDLKSNVVFSPHSYIPSFVSSNMTVNMFGKSVNFIEVGATSQGFENVLENLFGPEGFFWNEENDGKSFEEYFDDLFSLVKDTSLQTKEFEIEQQNSNSRKRLFQRSPKLDLFVRVFGHEVAWVPLRYDSFPNIAEKDMFHTIMSQIVELYQTFSLYNLQFVDTELSVPTLIGFPLRLSLKGAGHVDMTFFRDEKAKSKPLRPGLAMEVQGEMLMDYSLMSTGMTTVVDSFFAIEMAPLNMMESGNFIFKFDIPEQNIFKMESKAFTFLQMDGKRKEIPIELKGVASTNAAPMCFYAMGLETCYKNRISEEGILSSGVIYPFETSVYVSKSDPLLTHFHLEARSSDEGALYLLFDTPASTVDRKFKFEASLKTDGVMDLVLSLENPIHTMELRANAVDSDDLMKLEGKFVWGEHKYGMTARADLVEQGPHTNISPSVQIVVDGKTIRLLEGKVSVSEEEVIIDLASPAAGLTAKSQVLVSDADDQVKLQLKNIELSHPRFKYSGDGILEINEQDFAIIDVKLKYDHGNPHMIQIRGDFKPSLSGDKLEVRSKLDFVTSQAPQYNFRVKFDVDDSFLTDDKHIIFNERFDIWYGPNFEKEQEKHIGLTHESTLKYEDDFDIFFSVRALLTPFDIDVRLEQVLILGTYTSQIKSKLLLHNTEYSGDLIIRGFHKKSNKTEVEVKVVYPGKKIILMNTNKEEKPGFHVSETKLMIDPGQQFDLHVFYHIDGRAFHLNVLSHDSEQLFRLTSNNTLSRSLFLFKSDLMVHNHKFMNYDVKWNEERTKGHNLEIQGHIEGVVDVSLTGNVSPGNLKLMYDIKLEKQLGKLVGMTAARQTSQGSDLVSTWKYLQQSQPLVDLKITLNSAPELRTGNMKLTVTQDSIQAELDFKLEKQLSGEHKVVAKFETPADGGELQLGANFKSKRKTMYMKLKHPKIGTLFDIEGAGEVKYWEPHRVDILTDIQIDIKDYESFLIHAYLNHLHDPGLLTTDFKVIFRSPYTETGQIHCQFKSTQGMSDASILVHHYKEPSFYLELKGKADTRRKTYKIEQILKYGVSASQPKIFDMSLDLSVGLKEVIKISKGMAIRYNDKPFMETDMVVTFDPVHLTHVNGSFDLVTPFVRHEHYWLYFNRKVDTNTGETKHGLDFEFSKGVVGLKTKHLLSPNLVLLDILLTTSHHAFDKFELNIEHKVDIKRESFKTDFGVILPQYGEIHLNNDLKWDRKIKSVDFKSHLFGEEFLQLEGALDGRVLMQTDVFLKIMYETLKVIEVSGKILRGHDTYDGSFSIEPAKEFEVPNLKISFALTQKPAQDSTLKVVVKMDDEQLLKSMFNHTNLKDKFKVSGVIYLNEKTDLHTIKAQFSKEPKAIIGKFFLLEDKVETMNVQFSRIKRPNKDLADLGACFENDCLQLKFQKSDNKGHSHELELQSYERNIETPEGQTNYTLQYKIAKNAEEFDHYIKISESAAGSKETVGYRVQYKQNTVVLSLILPQRLMEITGGVAVKPNKLSFHSSFSIDKEKKPANKLQVNFDINKTTERERGLIYAYKGSISHPKFNGKTISVEGEVTRRGARNIFGLTCDFKMLDDASSSFKIDYILYHAETFQNIHHLNCMMNLSITSQFLQIDAQGNYVHKYRVPQGIGAFLAFSAKGSPKQTLRLEIIGDTKKRGHLDILLSHNEKKIDFKNVYSIQTVSPGNFQLVVQSSLVSNDGKMTLASDLVFKKKLLESQKTVVWGTIHAYDEHAKEKYFFAVGSEDAKKIELLAGKGSDHLLTHVMTSLNNSRILHSRLAWREENILQALQSAKQTASLVYENLSDMGRGYWKELSTKTSDALKKVNFNNKLIRDFKASYIRNFKEAAKDFVSVILDEEETQELFADVTSLVEEIGFSQLIPNVNIANVVLYAARWSREMVMGTLLSKDYYLHYLKSSIRKFIEHNNFPVTYVGAVDSVLKNLWHYWISQITEVPEHFNVFEPSSPGEIVSVSKIESRVKQVLKEVTSNPNKSEHFWTDLYNRKITLIYRMMGDEFIRLVKFLREGPGKFVLYEPKWTDIQYEMYLSKSVRDLHDIPTMLVQHYLPLFTNGHSTNHFMKLFETEELFPPFQSSALISGEGYIKTFDGDIIHFPTQCSFTLIEDLVNHKFSLESKFSYRTISLVLKIGDDLLTFDFAKQDLTVLRVPVDGDYLMNYTLYSDDGALRINVEDVGFEFKCRFERLLCGVTVSGFHHGKLGGLFGTNDNEFYNEKMKPSGELFKNNREFSLHWNRDDQCQYPAVTDVQKQESHRSQCEHIFDEEDPINRSCFKSLQPKRQLKSCINSGLPETAYKIFHDECSLGLVTWELF